MIGDPWWALSYGWRTRALRCAGMHCRRPRRDGRRYCELHTMQYDAEAACSGGKVICMMCGVRL